MNSSFTFYLRETYLQQFIGQYINIEGTDYAELIKAISIELIQALPSAYNINIYCTTQFNQRVFNELNVAVSDIENTVKLMSNNIEQTIQQPLVDFTLP